MNQASLRASSGRLDRFLAILQHALRVGKSSAFLRCAGAGKRKTSVAIVSAKALLVPLGRVAARRTQFRPRTMSRTSHFTWPRGTLQASVRRAHRWILTHHKQAVHFSVEHLVPVAQVRNGVSRDPRQPVEAEVVPAIAESPYQALSRLDGVLVKVCPQARCASCVS